MERTYGSFYRRLPLPEGVKAEVIEATFTDGVLEVKVPKPASAEAKPTKVAVK
jgi:HSP20 family protein